MLFNDYGKFQGKIHYNSGVMAYYACIYNKKLQKKLGFLFEKKYEIKKYKNI